MINYLSLVIIFIKRTDRSQKQDFLWQNLERDSEGLGGEDEGEERDPTQSGWDIDNLIFFIWSWDKQVEEFSIRDKDQSDILIKTFLADTSYLPSFALNIPISPLLSW